MLQVTLFTQSQLRSPCPGKPQIPHTPQPPCGAAHTRQDAMHTGHCHCSGYIHANAFFLCFSLWVYLPTHPAPMHTREKTLNSGAVILLLYWAWPCLLVLLEMSLTQPCPWRVIQKTPSFSNNATFTKAMITTTLPVLKHWSHFISLYKERILSSLSSRSGQAPLCRFLLSSPWLLTYYSGPL